MAEVFNQIVAYMQENAIAFSFNGNSYEFTWWQFFVALMVMEVGIFVVGKIMGD